jgi:hypothetical protein
MKSQFTNEQINEVMEQRGVNRKSALKWLNRSFGDKKKAAVAFAKTTRAKHDATPRRDSIRVPGIGDIPLVEAPKKEMPKPEAEKLTPEQVSANRKEGLRLFRLAGKPKKSDFVKVFGKKGIAWTWEARAKAVGLVSAEECAAKFQSLLAKAVR